MPQTISQGQKHPASGLQPKGTAQQMPSESISIIEALFPLAKLWSAERHHQNRANTARSYYKGKPGPEDQAPQPLPMGNPCSILYSKSHAGMHKLLGWGTKNTKPPGLCPCIFTHRFTAKATSFSWSQRWVTETKHFYDTSPSPQMRQRWHIIPLLVRHRGTKYPRALTRHRITSGQRQQWPAFRTSVV